MRQDISSRRLRAGIVGGGRGAFIGAVHRMAAELDGESLVVAGALSSDPGIAAASACPPGCRSQSVSPSIQSVGTVSVASNGIMSSAAQCRAKALNPSAR